MPLTEERNDPNPESLESVPFYNFTSEDFTVEQGAMYNSKPYLVKAGEIKYYPKFLADHLCKHLINRELIRTNEASINNDELRKKVMVKILISHEEAAKLLGLPVKDRIVKVSAPKKKKELMSKKEAETIPHLNSKLNEAENIPEVEHTKEYKNIDIQSFK